MNPFLIAKDKNITILYEDLGTIDGFYINIFGCLMLHINHNLPKETQELVCIRELYYIFNYDYNVHLTDVPPPVVSEIKMFHFVQDCSR